MTATQFRTWTTWLFQVAKTESWARSLARSPSTTSLRSPVARCPSSHSHQRPVSAAGWSAAEAVSASAPVSLPAAVAAPRITHVAIDGEIVMTGRTPNAEQFEGVIDHHLLGLHHVNETVPRFLVEGIFKNALGI